MTTTADAIRIPVGLAEEDWTGDARFFEYHQAVDPLRSGTITPVPIRTFRAAAAGVTGVVPLDLSGPLGTPYAATSPALLASFVGVAAGEALRLEPVATSELFYVLRGAGRTTVDGGVIAWQAGDLVVLPAGSRADHEAALDATLYHVSDAPLLAYLGVRPAEPRFAPTLFRQARLAAELDRVAAAPDAATRNRISVLLGNAAQSQTLTVTHTLWAMLGLVPAGAIQRPHRHQSVALDLVVDCSPGCYTLLGEEFDPASRAIVDPVRVDWEPGAAFVTPPGMWHSHHNESGRPARILPIQDAGLHTYLRSLDIRFRP
ncbi:MAG TPA: cupin domain-containing protein [Acidimicrobiia bacterium]|nr:cupin domain-containing protein [Acidimicrobiia bacterium]